MLKALDYNGPLGISCDDTKLHATLWTYWDSQADQHFLVGHTGDPMPIANPQELQEILRSAELEKATKLWPSTSLNP